MNIESVEKLLEETAEAQAYQRVCFIVQYHPQTNQSFTRKSTRCYPTIYRRMKRTPSKPNYSNYSNPSYVSLFMYGAHGSMYHSGKQKSLNRSICQTYLNWTRYGQWKVKQHSLRDVQVSILACRTGITGQDSSSCVMSLPPFKVPEANFPLLLWLFTRARRLRSFLIEV